MEALMNDPSPVASSSSALKRKRTSSSVPKKGGASTDSISHSIGNNVRTRHPHHHHHLDFPSPDNCPACPDADESSPLSLHKG